MMLQWMGVPTEQRFKLRRPGQEAVFSLMSISPSLGLLYNNQRITQGSDDAIQKASATDANNNALKLGKADANGLRFQGVNIPSGATVDSAFLYFDAPDKGGGTFVVDVVAEDNASPSTFTDNAEYDIVFRDFTSASVNWGATISDFETDIKSPDIKSIVQEVVDNQGGITDFAAYLLPTGTGEPDAIAYDDVPAQAPRLVINYTPSGGSLTTYDMRIAQSSDDAGEGFEDSDNNNATIDIGKGDFVGVRFQGVNLVSGTTIDSAFFIF